MKQKLSILVMLIAFMLLLTACGTGDTTADAKDTVSRFTEANPGNGESIDIPGYESLALQAGNKSQRVYLFNPEKNAAYFVMTLTLENGDTIWKVKALYPDDFKIRPYPKFEGMVFFYTQIQYLSEVICLICRDRRTRLSAF